MISFIMLNEHSTISPVKMLRQGRTKMLNTGYLFDLNALFHQTSNLSFSSGNGNSESVTYNHLIRKFQSVVSNLKGFHALKMNWCNRGSKAEKDLRRGLFLLNIKCSSNISSVKLSVNDTNF